jgi:hypothetical protein
LNEILKFLLNPSNKFINFFFLLIYIYRIKNSNDYDFTREFVINCSKFSSFIFKFRKDIPSIIPIIGTLFSRKGGDVDYKGCDNTRWNNHHINQATSNNVSVKDKEYINIVLPIGILDGFIINNGFQSISEYVSNHNNNNNNITFEECYYLLKPYYFV